MTDLAPADVPRRLPALKRPEFRGPLSAIVSASGQVTELDSGAGARALRSDPDLVRHATAFLETGLPDVRFAWQLERRRWMWISMHRGRAEASGNAPAVVRWVVAPPPYELTSREIDVLTLLAGGLTNTEIADVLVTSPRTISAHVAHILEKLGQTSRSGASAVAVDEGLLRLPLPGTTRVPRYRASLRVELIDASVRGESASSRPPAPVHSRPTSDRHPLLVGSIFPSHGAATADAIEMRNGSALAIAEANERGGIHGRRVEQIVVEVDAFDPNAVRAAFAALVEAEVDALTSGYFLTEEKVVALAAEYGAPYLHAQTAESYVEYVREDPTGHGHIFQICPSETHYGVGFVRFLDELVSQRAWMPPSRRLVFVETPVSGGAIATTQALESAERSGWEVARVERVPSSGANWAQVVEAVGQVDPAAVMIANFVPEELASFQRAFVRNPTPALVYAVYAPSIPRFFEDAGDSAEGMLWATVSGTYGDALGRRFATGYERAYARPPGRAHAGIAYDGVQLLMRAWAEVDNPRDFAEVARRLRTNTHRGVNGSYFFDSDGQCGLAYPDAVIDPSLGQAHLVLQIRNRRHHVLSPVPYVEASFRPPPWCG